MPPKEKSSQNVKINIDLGDKKKPRKPRGKRKASQKKIPSIPMIYPRTFPQAQYSQQPQYIPLYVNQYPSYAGAGLPNYMNAGIPANPQTIAGTSLMTLGDGSAITPTTAMTKLTSNAKFNIPQSFYIPTEKPSYPKIDIKKRIEGIQQPKLLTEFVERPSTIGSEEFEKRREDIITQFEEIGGRQFPIGRQPTNEAYFDEEFQEIKFPRKPKISRYDEDDEDEGFFISSSGSLQEIPRIPVAQPPPPLSSAPPSYDDNLFYDYLMPQLNELEETKNDVSETFFSYA